jgi:hypothetical protein
MSMSNTGKPPTTASRQLVDRVILRELALCFARAAVDELLKSGQDTPANGFPESCEPGEAKREDGKGRSHMARKKKEIEK